MKEMVGGCCVCSDDRGWAENPLVYCDGQGCTVAVHQACYGIVTVPSGNWYCRKCESPERSARTGPRQQHCELCPSKDGAIKRTDNNGWAHVVCALYIPEVRFGNVTTMEPILLQHIPAERFHKVCYICEETGKSTRSTVGACMQCNKSGCKQQFHVTCAQALGLLCEEAGNYLDNVKYCGYCQHHYSKLKKGANVKTVPPYRPVNSDSPPSPGKDTTNDGWSKPPGKRKLSSSGKSAPSPAISKPSVGGKSSGTTSPPAPVTSAVSESPVSISSEDSSISPSGSLPSILPTTTEATNESPVNGGKFITSNFVESVVTPSGSVFGDSVKLSKKRKSQSKEDNPLHTQGNSANPSGVGSSSSDDVKRLKTDSTVATKPETQTPSVVVKAPSNPASTSPSSTQLVPQPISTSPPITATSSIVVSVPLAVASLPSNPVTTAPSGRSTSPIPEEGSNKRVRFQNGVSAPHMLGNQLNPSSTMAQKMSDTLNQELEAHSIFTSEPNLSTQPGQLVGPQLHNRVIASVRGNGAGTPQASSSTPSSSSGWASSNPSTPQTLDQLLERQWDQGSHFLMEQAQHFDIASLLTCLHQLKSENLKIEENVNALLQRRDHLLAVNARLAIPLVPPAPVNNIHSGTPIPTPPIESNRNVPVNSGSHRVNSYSTGMENGPTSPGQPYHSSQNSISRHHSPGNSAQPYGCPAPGVVVRSTNITSASDQRRSNTQPGSSHSSTAYPSSMYNVPSTQQSQMAMRRDVNDIHHQNSKNS